MIETCYVLKRLDMRINNDNNIIIITVMANFTVQISSESTRAPDNVTLYSYALPIIINASIVNNNQVR